MEPVEAPEPADAPRSSPETGVPWTPEDGLPESYLTWTPPPTSRRCPGTARGARRCPRARSGLRETGASWWPFQAPRRPSC